MIDPVHDLAQWVDAIGRMDAPELYASLSEAARQHAGALGMDVTPQRFGDLVRRELGMEL